MSLAIIFGTNLRHHRKLKGLTQSALADQISLSTEMISKIERGVASPSFANVEKLSEVLNVPEVALFGACLAVSGSGERGQVL
ncbi:XRE family transcriptional regulator [Methylobacterium terrae]|uniref:XRE family transcriptional regulator n=1 Tax=Methylobacterium terrae TaxID=2202827 RepID=A0A2U8WRJ0_9HYPH|nr:helix-turn-helix transcriptional regulator [Methylobacterium terrae]AWN48895.1 XRE family transcriptional regulator [Methylobacterium terrae]